jgi:hypothetical protein
LSRASPNRNTSFVAQDFEGMPDDERALSSPPIVADVVEPHNPATQPLTPDEFVDIFKKKLSQPLLSAPQRPHMTKAAKAREGRLDDDDLVPKRSARLAAKSKHRAQKPEAQARKVMMKRLGVEVETQLPDKASFEEFQTAFKIPL